MDDEILRALSAELAKQADTHAKDVLAHRHNDEYWHEFNQFINSILESLKRKRIEPSGKVVEL